MELKWKIKVERLNKRWKFKKDEIKTRKEGPTRNKKWGILKYLSAEISLEKLEIIRTEWCVSVVS